MATAATAPAPPAPLLQVEELRTCFHTDRGMARAVDGVSFTLAAGRTLAIVGESGCGKTVTALSILKLLPTPPAEIGGGRILFQGRDLLQLKVDELRRVRGGEIAMIFQEPATSLNPVFTVGQQLTEAVRLHRADVPANAVRQTLLQALAEVRISEPERRLSQYPHELSGGMKQRVMIAMALVCRPKLLIADEPTTALDVTIQARILDLLRRAQRERGMGLLLITHDLGVVAEMADDVAVMYAGKVVEQGPVKQLFARPLHPYTRGLFASLPRVDCDQERLYSIDGQVPPATRFPPGCRFRERCLYAHDACTAEPPLATRPDGQRVACWVAEHFAAGHEPPRAPAVQHG